MTTLSSSGPIVMPQHPGDTPTLRIRSGLNRMLWGSRGAWIERLVRSGLRSSFAWSLRHDRWTLCLLREVSPPLGELNDAPTIPTSNAIPPDKPPITAYPRTAYRQRPWTSERDRQAGDAENERVLS